MSKKIFSTAKWIPWPGIGQVDKQKIAPIVDNHYFRRLSDKKQLAFAYLVFPGATHDRRQHSMGAYVKTQEFTNRMVERGFLTPKEAWNLSLYALLHDIGHGPFSHIIEVFTKGNHKEYGIQTLHKMAADVKRCGGNPALIEKYMSRKDPAWQIVSDKNFGIEKMDYLVRDQEATEFGPNIRRCVESVFNHLEYRDGRLVVDIKALDAAIEIQRAYIYFYRNVHLEKSAYIIQRFMQKLMYQLLHTPQKQGGITESELWDMVDGDLIHALKQCQHEMVQNGIAIFDRGVRHFPKTALSIRLTNYGWLERRAGKKIKVFEIEKSFFDKFFTRSSAADLEKIETKIARILGVSNWQVAVSHIVEKNRFIPQDVTLFDGPKLYSLKEQDPSYFELLERELDKYLCVRVCISPQHRPALYRRWKKALEVICDHVGYKLATSNT